MARVGWILAGLLVACSSDPAGSSTGGTGGAAASSTGGQGGQGGTATGSTTGGGGIGGSMGDLGWPLDDSLPAPCPPLADDGGTPWTGWGNLQFPASLEVATGGTTEPIYGRTFAAGQTPGAGPAAGWDAELGVGPLGTTPDDPAEQGRCWSFVPAAYNVDVGNDDEYVAALTPDAPGLFGLYYRYRPPGGAWRYGDLNGSDDGVTAEEAGRLVVAAPAMDGPVVAVTLNLRCRLDDWPARLPLVVEALARVDPDLVAFQEDCIDGGGPSQAAEIRAALASYTGRGYDLARVSTHQATGNGFSYDEGISLISAHPIASSYSIDLPFAQIPRKALAANVTLGGMSLRFYSTHFDFGTDNAAVREQAAEALVADLPGGLALVGGDLNAAPEEAAIAVLDAALGDRWTEANPSAPGLTFPADGPTRRIDYLFGGPTALLGAKLLDEQSGGTWLSDHLGVAVAMALR